MRSFTVQVTPTYRALCLLQHEDQLALDALRKEYDATPDYQILLLIRSKRTALYRRAAWIEQMADRPDNEGVPVSFLPIFLPADTEATHDFPF